MTWGLVTYILARIQGSLMEKQIWKNYFDAF